jgi:hypothetical protein
MGGARRAGFARAALAGGALGTLLALGCAGSDLVVEAGRLRHVREGYSVALLTQRPWTPVTIKGTELAYRGMGAVLMSFQARCGRPQARPQIMARNLVIGLPARQLRQAGPVTVGEWQGWSQVFDTLDHGVAVRVKTVTIVAGRCTFDWVLSARDDFEEAALAFDAWWQSFEYEPRGAESSQRKETGT